MGPTCPIPSAFEYANADSKIVLILEDGMEIKKILSALVSIQNEMLVVCTAAPLSFLFRLLPVIALVLCDYTHN